ncbi:MAG: cysteine hydrolase, partial [Inconstantimicrobium porci]|nr:cysteine hydrolase [Inconstantimicrobium porci]
AGNTIHINKSSFGVDPEDMIHLREILGEVNNVEVVGVVTDICVISNVVTFQSTFANANIIVDSKLTATFDKSKYNSTLDVMKSLQVIVK